MELQTSSILVLILITVIILIVYSIYLIFSETNRIKKDSKSLEEKIENLDKTLLTVVQEEISKSKEPTKEAEFEDWIGYEGDEEEELESNVSNESNESNVSQHELKYVLKTKNNTFAPSFEIFGSSNEELEHLQNLQMQIEGKVGKLEEIIEESEPEYPEHLETTLDVIENQNPSVVSINLMDDEPVSKTCEKQLSHGKRKGELCNKKTFESGNFCKLHLA